MKLFLKSKEFNEMPYAQTKTKWTSTKGEIEGIIYALREKGIVKQHVWATDGKAGEEVETLFMVMELPISDSQLRRIELKFVPTMIFVEKTTGSKRKKTKKRVTLMKKNTSWRLFWWFFKAKMESVLYGLESMEEVFMSNIVHRIPDQSQPSGFREMTMGEGLKEILLENKLGKLLEYKPKPKVIEVEPT